jgi:hypothetical protein
MKRLLLMLLFVVSASYAQVPDEDIAYHAGKRYVIVESNPAVIQSLDRTLQAFASWGLNPAGVVVSDFDFAFIVAAGSCPVPKVCIPATHYVVARHKKSKASDIFNVEYIFRFGAYPAAARLVALKE